MDEALKRRHLILDVLHKLELNSGALKIVAWSICFEINVPFKMIRKEAQPEFQGGSNECSLVGNEDPIHSESRAQH